MSEAIFKTVGQALYISFLMEIITPGAKSSTDSVINSLMENCGMVFDGYRENCVNTRGMTVDEWRGQCAIIRQMVTDELPKPEKYAIWARYAQYDNRIKVITKADGVEGIAHHVESVCSIKGDTLLELCVNFYGLHTFNAKGKRINPPSLRSISDKYHKSLTTLTRSKQVIAAHAAELEMIALSRLEPLIQRKKLTNETVSA